MGVIKVVLVGLFLFFYVIVQLTVVRYNKPDDFSHRF